jgi:uncharacterized coiled-coil protein SlyX
MATTPTTEKNEILTTDAKKMVSLIAGLITVVATAVGFINWLDALVEKKLDDRLGSEVARAEEQQKKIEKLENQVTELREMLIEIRSDVRYLRVMVTGQDQLRVLPPSPDSRSRP